MKHFRLQLDDELHRRLKVFAASQDDVTMHELIVRAVEEFLDREDRKRLKVDNSYY